MADDEGMDPVEFAAVAARHHHVLGPSVRDELGLSPWAWRRSLRRDDVQRPFRDVRVLPGAEGGGLTRARAALCAVQCRVALTGWSAANLHGLVDTAPSTVHLLMPHGASITRRDGLELTETSAFPTRLHTIDELPVVPVSRLLADLSPTTRFDALLNLAVDARFARLLRASDLDRELGRRRRFPGRTRFRQLADDLRDDTSDSGFEFHARERLDDLGLAPDPGQHRLLVAGRERRIDLPWRDQRVGVECLGLAAHSGRRAFDADADRRNDFAEDGTWLILELTWTTFHRHWDDFVGRLRRVLDRRPAR